MIAKQVVEDLRCCLDGYCDRCLHQDLTNPIKGACRARLMRSALTVILEQGFVIEQLHDDSKEIVKAAMEAAAKSYFPGAVDARKCDQNG